MGQMVDGLLEHTYMGRIQILRGQIDINELSDKLCKHINRLFKKETLPSCNGVTKWLKRVWQQPMANTVKFTQLSAEPIIEIGSGKTPDETTIYYIRDNDIDFDMQYSHKLFGVFQRFHLEDGFESIGMGLAVVRRIIEQHEGHIWAEAEENEGATFFFKLG